MAKEITREMLDGLSARVPEFFLILKQGNLVQKSAQVESRRAQLNIASDAVLNIALGDAPFDEKVEQISQLFKGDKQTAEYSVEIVELQKLTMHYALAMGGNFTETDALQRDLLFRRARKEFVERLVKATGLGEKQVSDGILRQFEDAVAQAIQEISGKGVG